MVSQWFIFYCGSWSRRFSIWRCFFATDICSQTQTWTINLLHRSFKALKACEIHLIRKIRAIFLLLWRSIQVPRHQRMFPVLGVVLSPWSCDTLSATFSSPTISSLPPSPVSSQHCHLLEQHHSTTWQSAKTTFKSVINYFCVVSLRSGFSTSHNNRTAIIFSVTLFSSLYPLPRLRSEAERKPSNIYYYIT